jgi:hypothetical protein
MDLPDELEETCEKSIRKSSFKFNSCGRVLLIIRKSRTLQSSVRKGVRKKFVNRTDKPGP